MLLLDFQPPPITPPGLEGFLAWIPTATLLTVVFAAGKLHHQFKSMDRDLRSLGRRVHKLRNAFMISNPDAWTRAETAADREDEEEDRE